MSAIYDKQVKNALKIMIIVSRNTQFFRREEKSKSNS